MSLRYGHYHKPNHLKGLERLLLHCGLITSMPLAFALAFGPVVSTTNSTNLLNQLDEIETEGGGDCPELLLHGLQLALSSCLPKSNIFVFTDAGVKDLELEKPVYDLMESRGSVVNFFFTARTPRACSYRPYLFEELAERSGGQVLKIGQDTVVQTSSVSKTVEMGTTASLLFVTGTTSSPHSFQVDCTVQAVTIEATGQFDNVQIQKPDSTFYMAIPKHSEAEQDKQVVWLHLPASEVQRGKWTVTVFSSPGNYVLNVSAVTSVNFFYQFVDRSGRPGHMGIFPIQGEPLSSKLGKLVLTIVGLTDLASVTGVDIQTDNGTTINQLQLEVGHGTSNNLFGVAFPLNPTPFRILFRAVDHCGFEVLRYVPKLVKPQPIQLQDFQPVEKTRLVEPGKTVDIGFKLHNTGETNDFEVVFTVREGFSAEITIDIIDILEEEQSHNVNTTTDQLPKELRERRDENSVNNATVVKEKITLKPGQTAAVTIIVKPPEKAELGELNTAKVEVVDNTGETINSLELDMVVAPEVMSIPLSASVPALLLFQCVCLHYRKLMIHHLTVLLSVTLIAAAIISPLRHVVKECGKSLLL